MNQDKFSEQQDQAQDEGPTEEGSAERKEREVSFGRRALLQAGWAVPTVLMFSFPDEASAISLHTDIPGPPHGDIIGHLDN